jgi:hypothetical protein
MPLSAAEDNSLPPLNRLVLHAVASMPAGGGYSASASANHALSSAVTTSGGVLAVDASGAMPSYCSGATYLVFLKVIAELCGSGRLTLPTDTLLSLRPSGQPDGTGIWGRWNANGPGTARLFYELGLGANFTSLEAARPGDFLKIFWNGGIGVSEHGHSVIFLGHDPGKETLTFWSSNIPGGFGQRTVPLRRINRMLFSRLDHPAALSNSLPGTDAYLRSLQNRSSSPGEMARECGILR